MFLREKTIEAIKDYSNKVWDRRIELLFKDPARFKKFSIEGSGIFLDFSKTNVDDTLLELLKNLLSQSAFFDSRSDLFSGGKVNVTEAQPAYHTLMRSSLKSLVIDGKDIRKALMTEQNKMLEFCERVEKGQLTGSTGKKFTDVVNIGIGGSQMGPEMVIKALKPFQKNLKVHFLSNIDPSDLIDILDGLDPETTLFIVVSKSFSTLETINNAGFAKGWLKKNLVKESLIENHFVAISSFMSKIESSFIKFKYKFEIHNYVGGRYSLWGPAGISIALSLGTENFKQVLDGAFSMDTHFYDTEIDRNLPVILGLIGIWHSTFCNYHTLAIIPYEKRLEVFPKYIQQLQMESNGKSVSKNGREESDFLSPVIWGDVGTNSQHSFFQYLHQGPQVVPCEFIIGRESYAGMAEEHHNLLKVNCVAQAEALMVGENSIGMPSHKIIKGNKPSLILIYDKLGPFELGALSALYEHKVFVEGVLMNVNSFDQFGVELGKRMVAKYGKELKSKGMGKNNGFNFSSELVKNLFR